MPISPDLSSLPGTSSVLAWVRAAGIAGAVGAVLWILGDVLLIGASAARVAYPIVLDTYADRVDTGRAATMLPSAPERLAAGALVGNVGIVFYLAGSWHLYRGLLPAGRRWAWPIFALLLCGNAWAPLGHAAYYFLGMTYKTLEDAPPQAHNALLDLAAHFETFLQIAFYLPIVTLGLALTGLGIRIALGRTAWPRWFALVANPASVLAIGTALPCLAPEPVATWLSGAAFNLGLLAVYLTSTALLWNTRPTKAPGTTARSVIHL